jgi:hypothetical protein
VVLADAEDVEADLVGERDLLDDLLDPLGRADPRADIRERVHAEFHG